MFKEKEFADLLHQCHNVIRNREKKDPAAAFDEIAKILFVKVYVERKLLTRRSKENLFTVDTENHKALQKEMKSYLSQMEEKKASESRQLLKERFDYPIFMYEVEKVGISATGDEEQNELYPNLNQPDGIEKTCLEYYKSFLKKEKLPSSIGRILGKGKLHSAFYSNFSDCTRWDPISFCKMDWKWSEKEMQHLGDVLDKRQEPISKELNFSDLQPVTIHFDGTMDKRRVTQGRSYSMQMFKADAGDLVVSKIDLKNGAVGIIPNKWGNVTVTGHFAVYSPKIFRVYAEWIQRVIQQPDFKEFLWRHKVGAEGRKKVKLNLFESIKIPIPDPKIQKRILDHKQHIIDEIEKLKRKLIIAESQVKRMIHGDLSNE